MTTKNPINPTVYTELHTQEPARARAFYGELFGWKSEEQATPGGPYTTFPGVLAGLTASRIAGLPVGWVPYVGVEDIAEATARAKKLGAEVVRDSVALPDGTFSVLRDPTGGVIGLWQARAK